MSTAATDSLKIRAFVLGDWGTNCYVVHAPEKAQEGQPCWVIDAGINPDGRGSMIEYIRENRLEPQAVLLTHAHIDHIMGLEAFRLFWPELPILVHEVEREFLTDPTLNLSADFDHPMVVPAATGVFKHGDVVEVAGRRFEIRHVPGHSPGGVAFYQREGKIAFVGDALFAGSIGNTSFPTSDHALLMRSLREQLMTLPDETRVLPGHGRATTIGTERRTNPFLRGHG